MERRLRERRETEMSGDRFLPALRRLGHTGTKAVGEAPEMFPRITATASQTAPGFHRISWPNSTV